MMNEWIKLVNQRLYTHTHTHIYIYIYIYSDLGKQLFREHVMGSITLKNRTITDILTLIKEDR